MTVKVTVKDTGAKRAMALLSRPRKRLFVGVFGANASRSHLESIGRVTVGEVAFWGEFGTPDIEPRWWLRGWLDNEIDKVVRQLTAATLRVLFGKPPESETHALEKLGAVYVREIVDRIRFTNEIRGNESSTIRKKGFDLPLIDSEQFIESIDYEVK